MDANEVDITEAGVQLKHLSEYHRTLTGFLNAMFEQNKTDIDKIVHDANDIIFEPEQDVSQVIVDYFAKHNPPYSMKFMSKVGNVTTTLKNVPADCTNGFIINAICLWDIDQVATEQKPNYHRAIILELTDISSSKKVNPKYKYVARVGISEGSKPPTYPTIEWQALATFKYVYTKEEVDAKIKDLSDRIAALESK